MQYDIYRLLSAVFLLLVVQHHSSAQTVLYDNLNNLRGTNDDHLTPDGSDGMFAQQFFIGDHTNIDQVTVSLQRTRRDATGSLRLELWRDNGFDQPFGPDDSTGKIADLGTVVDVSQIPLGIFGEYTFDNMVLGLEPNSPYWIVTNFEGVSGNNHVGVATAFSGDPRYPEPPGYDAAAGTNEAAFIHGNRNRNPTWTDLSSFFGLEDFYQVMRVEAMEQSTSIPSDNKVGDPTWKVGDIHHFSGPSSEDERAATVRAISPPSMHCSPRDLPHDALWARQLATAGFEATATFLPSDIDEQPNGIFTTLRLLPDPGEIGSSLDAEIGPIIPTELLPIHARWQWIRNGEIVDEGFEQDFNHPNCLVDGFDGLTSFQQFSSTDSSFFPPGTELVGQYETQLQIRDSQGHGWDVTIPFQVVNDVSGDVHFDGILDITDIDVLSSAVRQSLTEAKFDVNADGEVTLDDRTHWVHHLANTQFGDANLDGEFNADDLTTAFQTGEYEDNITLNSTWAEGDWNGDGDFDSADLALAGTLVGDANLDGTVSFPDFLALSAGFGEEGGWAEGDFDGSGQVTFPDFLALSAHFGQSTTIAAAVPEPSGAVLAVLAGLAFMTGRRKKSGDSVIYQGLAVCLLGSSTAFAQVALYDNTDLLLGEGERLLNPVELDLLAQPFTTDMTNTIISSVTVPMFRVGSPTGELQLSVWDDNGGTPGQLVAEIGSVPNIGDLPLGARGQEVLEPYVFDQPVSGLAPNTKYYVVLDHIDLATTPPVGNNLGVGGPRSSSGTNDAGSMLALAPEGEFGTGWFDLIEPLGVRRHLQMSITAVKPEPFGGRPRYLVPTPITMGTPPGGGIGNPGLADDGLTMFFDAGNPLQVWTMSRSSLDEEWGDGSVLGDGINAEGRNYGPDVSGDGLELYFVRGNANIAPPDAAHPENRLMFSERQTVTDPWSEAVELPANINNLTCVSAPTVTGDGLELYFNASDQIESNGICRGRYADVYVSKRDTKNDDWGEAAVIESLAWTPAISSDGLRLYFLEGDRTAEPDLPRGELADRPSILVRSRDSRSDEFGPAVLLGDPPNSTGPYTFLSNPEEFADGQNRSLFFLAAGGQAPADDWIWETSPAELCDINADGLCNSDDLTRRSLFARNLVEGSDRESDIVRFDISGDGLVNETDIDVWLQEAASANNLGSPYLAGDTNLDGVVDFTDFLALSAGFGGSSRDWSNGNFNGDGDVNFPDFLALSANFGQSSAVSAVPEPSGSLLDVLSCGGLVLLRRTRRTRNGEAAAALAVDTGLEQRKSKRNYSVLIHSVSICSLILAFQCQLRAQTVRYDNLVNLRGTNDDHLTPDGSDGMFAQQFFIGDHTSIDQVTVSLQRTRRDATGSLRLELWRDNGSNQPLDPADPAGKIADLGTVVDVSQIPLGAFGEYTFDNLVLGLEPNRSYWIVTNFEEVNGNNDIGVATAFSGDPRYSEPPNYDAAAGRITQRMSMEIEIEIRIGRT